MMSDILLDSVLCAYLHNVDVVQFLALLGNALSPESLSIAAFSVARSVVTISHLPVFSHRSESFLPESNSVSVLIKSLE